MVRRNEKHPKLNESINANLKDYLKSDHGLIQFLMHFQRVLNDKRYKENEVEYDLCQKIPKITIPIKMLIVARNTYTKIIFEKFQKQYIRSLELYYDRTIEDNEGAIYLVREPDASRDDYISCMCRMLI